VEFSDLHYCPLDDENEAGKEKVAGTIPEKTIQITVEQQTSQ